MSLVFNHPYCESKVLELFGYFVKIVMTSQQRNNPRPPRGNSDGSISQSDGSPNQLDLILSRLSILDGIAEDIAGIRKTQKDFSDRLTSCLRKVEAHDKILKKHTSSLQECSEELRVLKVSHTSLEGVVSDLGNQLVSMDVVGLEKNQNLLRKEVSNLKDIVKPSNLAKVFQTCNIEPSSTSYIDPNEIFDRIKRANNLVMRNVPENENESSDRSIILDIISRISEGSASHVLSVRRLGQVRQGAFRPVKIEFSNLAAPSNILRHKRILSTVEIYKKVSIDSDKTPLQIKHLRDLRRELHTRRSSGESDLTIRYKKGIPSITTLSSSDK